LARVHHTLGTDGIAEVEEGVRQDRSVSGKQIPVMALDSAVQLDY